MDVNSKLTAKLKDLPKEPGVYFHKDASGEIIYIGKAANLRSRVRQYFQKSRLRDPKTDALVNEIVDTDWVVVETELDALFVEAEMIRRYMPRYNILLRDDKSFVYVRIDINNHHPTVSYTRRPLDDGAEYFGPYLSKFGIARALKYLRRAFPYSTHTATNIPKRACLQAQIGLCPGLEADMTTLDEYRRNLRMLMRYLRGSRKKLVNDLEQEMKVAAKSQKFEEAARLRNKLHALKSLEKQVIFGDRELVDISKDNGLIRLAEILQLDQPPRRVEGFDISHMQGTDNVASMVVFAAGVPDKGLYRKFKLRVPGNDDFAHMHEAISRRLSERNIKQWGVPDLFLIDGGKGQVAAAQRAISESGQNIPLIGLAKRFEEIIIPKIEGYETLVLRHDDDALKLLMRIRDESHRFAVSYHSTLKRKRQTTSRLDDILGIGPATKKLLIRHFGSMRGIDNSTLDDLAAVVGPAKAKLIKSHGNQKL